MLSTHQITVLDQMGIDVWENTRPLPGAKVVLDYEVFELGDDGCLLVVENYSMMSEEALVLLENMLKAMGYSVPPDKPSPAPSGHPLPRERGNKRHWILSPVGEGPVPDRGPGQAPQQVRAYRVARSIIMPLTNKLKQKIAENSSNVIEVTHPNLILKGACKRTAWEQIKDTRKLISTPQMS